VDGNLYRPSAIFSILDLSKKVNFTTGHVSEAWRTASSKSCAQPLAAFVTSLIWLPIVADRPILAASE